MPKCIKCNNNMILNNKTIVNNNIFAHIYTCKNCTNIRQKHFIDTKTQNIIGVINYKEI